MDVIERWSTAKAVRYYQAAIRLLEAKQGKPEKRESKLARDANTALDAAFTKAKES
ncbi:hypothetical protein GGQ85_002649 [Nitrobacter vulgaris]|uniref:hypothetical protein n=1 Tax=Nitrobacter vulgaris TaxID=29421 RepID=UPI00285CF655|nr:hypothetical protein [Nitrobacter vulgaris]MDR6304933.1 hypothetical protein [Nitrobacter vulgaris]